MPEFDNDDDLDGLLHVESPLLARAFRGPTGPDDVTLPVMEAP